MLPRAIVCLAVHLCGSRCTIVRLRVRLTHHSSDMARTREHPRTVSVRYRGVEYTLDLLACRRALVNRQVDGKLDSMESLANAVGISRSTASRFFSGRPTSLAVTLKILEALQLTFEEVATLVMEDLAS